LGSNILPERSVKSITKNENGQVVVTLDNGQSIEADHIVIAAGIKPNTSLATLGDLEIDPKNGGIVVNSELQARSNLWVVSRLLIESISNLNRLAMLLVIMMYISVVVELSIMITQLTVEKSLLVTCLVVPSCTTTYLSFGVTSAQWDMKPLEF
jgi:predicted flavoprotein YhiN